MTGYTRQEVAHQAGVATSYVDQLVELDMLTPLGDEFSSGDVRRARWIHNFERAGVPLEDMAEAVGNGTLSFSFLEESAFDRFSGLSNTTFEELSTARGISLELLAVVREAFGHPEPKPEDYVREDELAVVSAVDLQLSSGFRPVVIERWLRVYQESLRRIAETETDWYGSEVVSPLLESGMVEAEMLETQGENSDPRWRHSWNRLSSPSITANRNSFGPGVLWSERRTPSKKPASTAGLMARQQSPSSTSPDTPG